MIFGGSRILFILCALVFALHFSTSNGYYLNNNGSGNSSVPENYMKDKECDGCIGYKCKLNDGKIIEGKDCFKNIVKLCQISISDASMLKSVVQNQIYEYKTKTYFIYSCQDNKYMNLKSNHRREKHRYNGKHGESCYDGPLAVSENLTVFDHKEYVENKTKCLFEFFDLNSLKSIEEAQNVLNDVKMAAEDILKAIDYAKKANEIMKDGEYFKKKAEEIGQKAENFSTIISEFDKMLKTLNESVFDIEKKCGEFDETAIACLKETSNCTIGQYNEASSSCEMPIYEAQRNAEDFLKIAKELMLPINEIKPEAEKIFMEANVFLTSQNAQELAKEAKKVGEKAIEIGMEAKMAANESMKIGNEANQKVMEVEKLAKDSLKLAEENQKLGDKTEAEIQKLKSNGEKTDAKLVFLHFYFLLLFFFIKF